MNPMSFLLRNKNMDPETLMQLMAMLQGGGGNLRSGGLFGGGFPHMNKFLSRRGGFESFFSGGGGRGGASFGGLLQGIVSNPAFSSMSMQDLSGLRGLVGGRATRPVGGTATMPPPNMVPGQGGAVQAPPAGFDFTRRRRASGRV